MLDFGTWSLLAFCSTAGLVILVGSLLLLWKRRIYLDSEGKSVSKVELPLGVKFETQFPVLVLFLIGGVLLGFPAYYSYETRHSFYEGRLCPNLPYHQQEPLKLVKLEGTAAADSDFDVFAVVDTKSATAGRSVKLDLLVPFIKNHRYHIKYIDRNGRFFPGEDFVLDDFTPTRSLTGVDMRGIREDAGVAVAPVQKMVTPQEANEFGVNGPQVERRR
jgi:hypothetical protein